MSGSDSNEGTLVESANAASSGNGSVPVETQELPEPGGENDTQCVRGLAYRDHQGFTTMFEDDDIDWGDSTSDEWIDEILRDEDPVPDPATPPDLHEGKGPNELVVPALLKIPGTPDRIVGCLVDTGAEVSIMSRSLYRQHYQEALPLTAATRRLTAADGQDLEVEGVGHITLKLEQREVDVRVVVANMGQQVVLGVDFLSKYRCSWDWDTNVLRLGDQAAGLAEVRVTAPETLFIPACSECIVRGSLSRATYGVEQAMLVGSGALCKDPGVVIANAIVDPRGNSVPVRLLNPQDRHVMVTRGSMLGVLLEADIIERRAGHKVWSVKFTGSIIPEQDPLPEEIQEVVDRLPGHLTDLQRLQAIQMLRDYADVVAMKGERLGHTELVQHQIDTGDARPIRQPPRREPQAFRGEGAKEVRRMLDEGVIEPADGPWASPVVLVKKPDGSIRYCVDYRKLNSVTRKDAYPLPRIDDCLDRLSGSTWFSTIDLASGYWQVAVHPADRDKTAFVTSEGLFRFRVMPFGLANAPATFERLMEKVLVGLRWETAIIYLDDVIVHARSFDEHLRQLRQVLERFRQANLKLKLKKCNFFNKEVKFLGHVVTREGIGTDPAKIEKVRDWKAPTSVSQLRTFLGLAGYYRRFVPQYARKSAPLTQLLKKNEAYVWGPDQQEAFDTLKHDLTHAPVLGLPTEDGLFIVDCDASNCGVGGVLSQMQDAREVPLCYVSKTLNAAERNYCTTRKELLAVLVCVEHFRSYLLGRRFLVRSDHGSLRWLLNFKNPTGQVSRWLERLAAYDFEIEHRPGTQHGNADGLSRIPCEGPCSQCEREECRRARMVRVQAPVEEPVDQREVGNDRPVETSEITNVAPPDPPVEEPGTVSPRPEPAPRRPRPPRQLPPPREFPDPGQALPDRASIGEQQRLDPELAWYWQVDEKPSHDFIAGKGAVAKHLWRDWNA